MSESVISRTTRGIDSCGSGRAWANPYLIDAVIGFSVVYKAFENTHGFKRFFGHQPNLGVS